MLFMLARNVMWRKFHKYVTQSSSISPEGLLSNNCWRDVLLSREYQENLVAVVIDEAHCVKKWYAMFI